MDPINRLALGPKVLGSVEASEAMHQLVSKGIEKWTKRDQHAMSATVAMLRDLHIGVPGCKVHVETRTTSNVAGTLQDGKSLVECLKRLHNEVNHFFYPEHLNTSPARMKGQKCAVYDNVFGIIGEQGEYFYCCSCCEWFSGVVGHPTIDNSNTTMLEKLHLLLQNARGESAWVIPEADEIIEFRDRDSTGTSLGTVPMKVYTVLKKYLHWDFESVACYLCVVSFVLLRCTHSLVCIQGKVV